MQLLGGSVISGDTSKLDHSRGAWNGVQLAVVLPPTAQAFPRHMVMGFQVPIASSKLKSCVMAPCSLGVSCWIRSGLPLIAF
jgi:hypothetical protein